VVPAGNYSLWSAEGLLSIFGAGGQWTDRWAVAQWVGTAAWEWWSAYSFSVSWDGEAFHRLGVQDTEVSASPWCFTSAKYVSSISMTKYLGNELRFKQLTT
jgi:hypothetical protein